MAFTSTANLKTYSNNLEVLSDKTGHRGLRVALGTGSGQLVDFDEAGADDSIAAGDLCGVEARARG